MAGKAWTDEEHDYLADSWGLLPDEQVAAHLGRTPTACAIRAKRFVHVSRKQQFYTSRNVGEIFGVDSHLVARWIADGALMARKSAVRVGAHTAWRIDEPAIVRFIKQHPHRYIRTRIERGTYWRNLADAEHARDPLLTMPEAARLVGFNIETVRRHLRSGWLTGVKRPNCGATGTWMVRRSELERIALRHPSMTVIASVAGRNARKGAA